MGNSSSIPKKKFHISSSFSDNITSSDSDEELLNSATWRDVPNIDETYIKPKTSSLYNQGIGKKIKKKKNVKFSSSTKTS